MTGFLLDTHTFLWFIEDDRRLPRRIKERISEPGRALYLSSASAFEIAIKHALGKLPIGMSLRELLTVELSVNRIATLPLRTEHLVAYAALPFPASGHRDPFDRILVAQARVEGLELLTADRAFSAYGVEPYA